VDVLALSAAKGIKKAGGPIWPSGSVRCGGPLRQIKKGTDVPRAIAPRGATNRSRIAAGLARFVQFISANRLLGMWAR
jgi:hypothetical protein